MNTTIQQEMTDLEIEMWHERFHARSLARIAELLLETLKVPLVDRRKKKLEVAA